MEMAYLRVRQHKYTRKSQYVTMGQNEIREDPLTGELVILSAERAKRPSDFVHEKTLAKTRKVDKACFFCVGNEDKTPPTIQKLGSPWRIRVFENKFPAVSPRLRFGFSGELFRGTPAYGHHEIIVETNEHSKQPQDMSAKELSDLLKVYQDRERAQYQDRLIRSAMIFRNHLAGGGASLSHGHSQMISLPLVMPRLLVEKKKYDEHREKSGHCIYCDLMLREKLDVRLVAETENYVVLAPYASKWAFQSMIVPKEHEPCFCNSKLHEFNEALLRLFRMYDRILANPPYNFFIHSMKSDFHWHFEFWPVLQTPAGLEKGADTYINTMPPENAAAELREAWKKAK